MVTAPSGNSANNASMPIAMMNMATSTSISVTAGRRIMMRISIVYNPDERPAMA